MPDWSEAIAPALLVLAVFVWMGCGLNYVRLRARMAVALNARLPPALQYDGYGYPIYPKSRPGYRNVFQLEADYRRLIGDGALPRAVWVTLAVAIADMSLVMLLALFAGN